MHVHPQRICLHLYAAYMSCCFRSHSVVSSAGMNVSCARPQYAVTTLTTVGYGDRVPNTEHEKYFSILAELAGGLVFGMLTGAYICVRARVCVLV